MSHTLKNVISDKNLKCFVPSVNTSTCGRVLEVVYVTQNEVKNERVFIQKAQNHIPNTIIIHGEIGRKMKIVEQGVKSVYFVISSITSVCCPCKICMGIRSLSCLYLF